jgi:hypothetical protein
LVAALSFTERLTVAKNVPGKDVAGCSRNTIEMLVSPDDIWAAFVQEEVCSDGAFVTTVVNYVQVERRGVEPTRENDVFAIVDHGALDDRPILQWLTTRELRIMVPNNALIGLQKGSYQEINVVVRFEPDDPADRQQFLKSLGLDPK